MKLTLITAVLGLMLFSQMSMGRVSYVYSEETRKLSEGKPVYNILWAGEEEQDFAIRVGGEIFFFYSDEHCFDFKENDRVVFLKGTADKDCEDVTIYKKSTKWMCTLMCV